MKLPELHTEIIDSAVCLESRQDVIQASDWLEMMEHSGITHAVVAPPPEYVAVYNQEGNRQILKLVSRHPVKLSGLAVANPWYGKKAALLLKNYLKEGLAGVYFHPGRQGFHLTDLLLNPLMEVCAELKKPVYCHTGIPVCAMPFQLAELARRFPAITFIMGHAGWSDFSGYDVIPAAKQAPNVVIESSCTTGSLIHRMVESLGHERVIFGSGYPQSMPKLEIDKILRINLSEDVQQKIFSVNARNIWKIKA